MKDNRAKYVYQFFCELFNERKFLNKKNHIFDFELEISQINASSFSKNYLEIKQYIHDVLSRDTRRFYINQSQDLFIKTTKFGDDIDRVLQHRDGEFTQLAEDLARYHQLLQNNCDRVVVLRPPTYSGYDTQLSAAMQCLGYTKEQFQFIVVQPIKLYAFHEPTQKLNAIPDLPADELIQAIGMDTIRWHSLRFPLTEIAPINISTAAQPIPQNSLYRVQAAHARCCVLLRQAHQQNLIQLDTEDQWNIDVASKDLADFTWANTCANELVKHIQSTSDILHQAAEQIAPHLICQHLEAMSNICHQWCNSLEPNAQDYVLLLAAKQKLFDLLHNILGIEAPEFIVANQPV